MKELDKAGLRPKRGAVTVGGLAEQNDARLADRPGERLDIAEILVQRIDRAK